MSTTFEDERMLAMNTSGSPGASASSRRYAPRSAPEPVALHEPYFGGNEWQYLKDCLDSTFVSSVGKYVDRFEVELAAFTGAKHAVAVVNGTAALHIALRLGRCRAFG